MSRCLVVLALTSACTMSTSARRTTIAGGAATMIVGGLVMKGSIVDANHNGVNEYTLDDHLELYALGSLLLVTGLALTLGGLASQPPAEPVAMPPPPPQRTELGNLEPVVPSLPPLIITKTPAPALPDIETSEQAVLLARKIRSAAVHGHCDVAWIMWRDLDGLDATYARALRDGPAMLGCAD